MFKRASIYNYADCKLTLSELESQVGYRAISDMTVHQLKSHGWGTMHHLSHVVSEDIIALTYEEKEKVIPSDAVKSELDTQVEQFDVHNGRQPNLSEKSDMKISIIRDMAKVALHKTKRIMLMISQNTNQVIIASTSDKDCDSIAELLFKTFGMQLTALESEESLSEWMTNLILGIATSSELSVMDSGVLTHDKEKMTIRNSSMEADPIVQSIGNGYMVKELALANEDASFTLTEDLVLKGIKYDVEFDDDGFHADLLIVRDVIVGILSSIKGVSTND